MENLAKKHEQREAEKTYLYHMVPKDMRGTELHPLNTLRLLHPDIFDAEYRKYEGRDKVTQDLIHTLDCSWNDVIHLSPVHPQTIMDALRAAGFTPQETKFFQIDPALLDPTHTTIYLFKDTDSYVPATPDDFKAFTHETLLDHTDIPESTHAHYKDAKEHNERPFLFVGIPHVLYKGSLDINSLPVITVK